MNKKLNLFFIFLIIMALFLTACNSKSQETKETVENSAEIREENKEMIIVKDVKGEVEIPKEPKKIVDLSGNSDILHILGFNVIGTANSDAYDYTKFPSYLEEELKNAKILGYSMQDTMDVEGILELKPDLIIISTTQEKIYDQLKTIAPTIMIQLEALDWKSDIHQFGKMLHKEKEAEEWISKYEEKAKNAAEAIKKAKREDASYLSFLASGGQIYVFDGAGIGDVLYGDMGLKKPEGMPKQTDISLPVVTYEGLSQIKADYIIVLATDEDRATLEENPIWKSIPAVQKGNVIYLTASPYFNQGYSSIGRDKLLIELQDFLGK